MEYLINLPIKIDCDKWLRIAEERELWPNNKSLYFKKYVDLIMVDALLEEKFYI